jgi:hypothetical protein
VAAKSKTNNLGSANLTTQNKTPVIQKSKTDNNLSKPANHSKNNDQNSHEEHKVQVDRAVDKKSVLDNESSHHTGKQSNKSNESSTP